MSVSLHNLNISLDNFNAAASGKYNIGQIKLNQDGTGVYRTNTHKTLTILNTTEISQEEAVAVKEAFCRAVKNEAKLDDTAVQELKEKLGIGSDKFLSMRAGTMTALTAAEVREVIDKYAGKINDRRAEGTQLKTSADLYKGVSQTTLDSRAAARDKVNAQTLAKFGPSEADWSLNSIMDLMDYEGGDSISDDTKKLAEGIFKHCQLTTIKPGKGFRPYENAPVRLFVKQDMTFSAKVTLDNGSDFSIDLGLTQKQMLEKLKDIKTSLAVDASFAPGARKRAEEGGHVEKPKEMPKPKVVDPLSLSKQKVEELKSKVLNDIKVSFDKIQTIAAKNDAKALQAYRENGKHMEHIIKYLQFALIAVRGHNPLNAVLGNRVRDVFLNDANADEKAPVDMKKVCDELYRDISEVLNKERINLKDVVDKDIENLGKTDASKKLQEQLAANQGEGADDLPTLKISELMGDTDTF